MPTMKEVWLSKPGHEEINFYELDKLGFYLEARDGDRSNLSKENIVLLGPSDELIIPDPRPKGQRYYELRCTGVRWRDIKKEYGETALFLAKSWALSHKKPWPVL